MWIRDVKHGVLINMRYVKSVVMDEEDDKHLISFNVEGEEGHPSKIWYETKEECVAAFTEMTEGLIN